MKPALSVIFFTVASGAGLGLAIWLVLARCFGIDAGTNAANRLFWLPEQWPALAYWFWPGVVLAGTLLSAGLVSSTLHLANPKNAWRAFARFRTSWLSREGVFALLIYPVAALYVGTIVMGTSSAAMSGRELLLAIVFVALALAVLYSTGMIYACLRTVPSWHTWHTRLGYPLFGLTSGLLLWIALRQWLAPADHAVMSGATAWRVIAILLLLAGFALKYHVYRRFREETTPGTDTAGKAPRDAAVHGPSVNAALNLPGKVRMLDVGHSRGTFLTNEFGFVLARERARVLKWAALFVAFLLPALVLWLAPGAAMLAALLALTGLLIERWLFFALARHVVARYHGA